MKASSRGIRGGEIFILLALVWSLLLGASSGPLNAQNRGRGGRRRVDLVPIKLSGGSTVEFGSFVSKSLGKEADYSIFLPPSFYQDSSKTYPVVYFLHGLNNDQSSWTVDRYGNLHEKVENMILNGVVPELIMVHPDGGNSFYCNAVDGKSNYEDFITKDLVEHLEVKYRARKDRAGRAIGGTSMGGYGALKIAMRHSDRYASTVGHSPIIFRGKNPLDVPEDLKSSRYFIYFSGVFRSVFGSPIQQDAWDANNPLHLASNKDLSKLNIYFDYGTADRYNQSIGLDKGVLALHRVLSDAKVKHTYKEHPGEPHGWALVAIHLEDSLIFLCQTF